MKIYRTKWFAPLFAVALGLGFFIAHWIGGSPRNGLARDRNAVHQRGGTHRWSSKRVKSPM